MTKKCTSVLDFGSSKITVIIGERGINNNFIIRGSGEAEYAGFMDGEFLEPEKLQDAMKLAVTNAEINSQSKIAGMYIGVPSAFSLSVCKSASQTYQKRIKISKQDIGRLFDIADEFKNVASHVVISRSPIYFILDDNRRILAPEGEYSSKLSASLCFILAEKKFVDTVGDILLGLNIVCEEYLPEALSEAMYLLEEETRNKYAILIDCGHITTSIALIRGDGLLLLNEFSLGGGHITADLTQCLKISYAAADSLKRKVVLSITPGVGDCYEIRERGAVVPIEAGITNEIVATRIEMIGKTISKCLTQSGLEYPDNTPIYLTGGGLSYIKGAKDLLGKTIGKNFEIVSPSMPQLEKPHYSSMLSLLDLALRQEEGKKKFFLWRLFK